MIVHTMASVYGEETAQGLADEQSERFVGNLKRILRHAKTPGPYIYDGYVKRLWPSA